MGQSLVRGSPRRLLVALGLSLCLHSAMAGLASAQIATIDPATITSLTSLNSTQTAQIDSYTRQALADLASDDPEVMRQARIRLLDPLDTRGIGVPFRLAYANNIAPALESLATDERELIALNAIRILGELATDRSSMAVETAMDHPSDQIRYTAVYAVGRICEAVANESPAIAPQRIDALIARSAELIRNEEDAIVLDRAVRTLIAAGSIDKENFTTTRERAYEAMASAVSDRVRTLPIEVPGPDRLQFMLRATMASRDALTDPRSLQEGGSRASAAMAGDVLAYVAERVQGFGEGLEDDERVMLNSLGATSQATAFFASTSLGGNAAAPRALPDVRGCPDNAACNDVAFIQAVVAEITRLYDPPFRFESGRFDRP